MAIDQEILDQLSALVGRRDLAIQEMQNWWAGAANGGPDGNGLFPAHDSTGFLRMLPSPEKVADTAYATAQNWVYPDEFDPAAGNNPDHDDTACVQAMFNMQLSDGRRPALRPKTIYYIYGQLLTDPSRGSLEGNHSIFSWERRTGFADPNAQPDLLLGTGAMQAANDADWTRSPNHNMALSFNGSMIGAPPQATQQYTEVGRQITAPAGAVVRVRMTLDYLDSHTVGSNTFRDIGISFRRYSSGSGVAGSIGSGGNVGGGNWFYSNNTSGYADGVTVW